MEERNDYYFFSFGGGKHIIGGYCCVTLKHGTSSEVARRAAFKGLLKHFSNVARKFNIRYDGINFNYLWKLTHATNDQFMEEISCLGSYTIETSGLFDDIAFSIIEK